MNRKISVGMAVSIVILAMTVTFSITMLVAMRLFDSTVSSVKEKESSVHQDGAGAAGTLAAPVLHRGQAQLVPQVAQQRLLLLRGAGDAVDHKGITLTHGRFLIS